MANQWLTKGEARRAAAATRLILVARFPQTFMPKGAIKRPLKWNIERDIRAACPDLLRSHIAVAIGDYCAGPRYLIALREGAPRLDLDGNRRGVVTAKDAAAAANLLAKYSFPLPPDCIALMPLRDGPRSNDLGDIETMLIRFSPMKDLRDE